MKKSFLIFLVLCSACIKPEEPPANVVPKDTMVNILIDIHLTEAKLSIKPLRPDSTYLIYQKNKEKIYNKYRISSARFDTSFSYYSRNPTELNEIYEVVVDSLGLMEERGKF